MMITNTATLIVLLAGILSSGVAQEEISKQKKDGDDFEIDNRQYLEYVNILKKECARNGRPGTFDRVKLGEESLRECVSETLNGLQRDKDETALRNFCPKASYLTKCFRNFTDILQNCYEPKDRQGLNINPGAINTILNFGCFFGENILRQFLNDGGIECALSEEATISDCTQKVFINYVLTGATGQEKRLKTPTGIDESSIIQNYLSCCLGALKNCQQRGISSDAINSVFGIFGGLISLSGNSRS